MRLGLTVMVGLATQTPTKDAHADAWENVATGARTAAMGGAGIAGGADSAMPTLNPAGVSRVPGSIVSLSASLYQLSVVTVSDYVSDGDVLPGAQGDLQVSQPGIQSREFGAFPSGLAYFYHFGGADRPMVLAGSLSLPRQINRRVVQNVEFLGDNVAVRSNVSAVLQESAYQLALSWGAGFGDLRLGASMLGGYTRLVKTQDRGDLRVLGTARFTREQSKEARELTSFDLGAVIGVQYDVTDWLRLGLSVRSPSLHLHGSFEGSADVTYLDDAETSVSTVQIQGDGVRGFPLRVGAGIELFGDRWSLAVDARLYVPRSAEFRIEGTLLTSSLGGEDGTRPDQTRALRQVELTRLTVDVAVGGEYWLDEANSVRVGAFTEFSALKSSQALLDTRMAARAQPDDFFRFPIDRFGASLGWGRKMGPADTTAGLRASFGSGDTLRRVPEQRFDPRATAEPTGATSYDVMAFLSAAVDLSEAASAIMGTPSGGGQ